MLAEKFFAFAQYADQVVLYLLLGMSVLSIGMILERFLTLKKISDDSQSIQKKMKILLNDNQLSGFEDLAKDKSTLEGQAAAQALIHIRENGEKGLTEIFNSFILSEKAQLEKYLGVLATIASNAPFIGLLGTVLGIMKAFNDLAQSAQAGQQTVMAGISTALVATAAGLFVAIPAGIFYNYYVRKVKGIYTSLEGIKELGLAFAKKRSN